MNLRQPEKEILGLIAEGYTTKEIAIKTKYAFNSVETIRGALLTKTKAKNTANLIAICYQSGILKLNP